jgi:hypothetical protein
VLHTPGRPLDAATRAFMEPRLGGDFSRVRVHTDAQAGESARAVNALAYTVGRDIVFAAAQYAPTIAAGRSLLAHELIHTIQQRAVPRLKRDELAASGREGAEHRKADTGLPANGPVQVHTGGAMLARQAAADQPVRFNFRSCSEEQQNKIRAATEEARKWVNKALSRLGAVLKNPAAQGEAEKNTHTLLRYHFKLTNETLIDEVNVKEETTFNKVSKIYAAFQQINAAFGKPLPIICEKTNIYPDLLGYVLNDNNIHLQPSWFAKDLSRRARNVVHEMAHRFADKGKDVAYEFGEKGKNQKKAYSEISTDEAMANADSYAGFAEDAVESLV